MQKVWVSNMNAESLQYTKPDCADNRFSVGVVNEIGRSCHIQQFDIHQLVSSNMLTSSTTALLSQIKYNLIQFSFMEVA